jgi:phage terminase small subunit
MASAKRLRFIEEYLIDLNATQAAIRAGYSKKTAGQIGEEILKIPEIAALIAERQGEISQKLEITQEMITAELAKIGFSDIRKAVAWFSQVAVAAPDERSVDEIIEDGGEIRHAIVNQVELVSSNEIDDATAAAISEISMTEKGGLKVKFHDKQTALVNLGKHLGMFKDTVKIEGAAEIIAALEEARQRAAEANAKPGS